MDLSWMVCGICLAGLSGLRAFLPLCVLIVAVHAGVVQPAADFLFLHTPFWETLISVLAGLELALSQWPALISRIRMVFFPLSLAAAVLAASALLPPAPQAIRWFLGLLVAGSLCAFLRMFAASWLENPFPSSSFRGMHPYFQEQLTTAACLLAALASLLEPWSVIPFLVAASIYGARKELRRYLSSVKT